MRRSDIVCALLLGGAGLFAIFFLIPRYVAPSPWAGDLPPSFMPYVAAIAGTVAMAVLLAERLLIPSAANEPAPFTRRSASYLAVVTLVLAVAFLLFEHIGYLFGAAFLVAGFMTIARAGARATAIAAVAFPVVLWLLFNELLGFPLP